MYDVILNIIGHEVPEEMIIQICSVCIPIFSVVFIDLMYRVFRHFWR